MVTDCINNVVVLDILTVVLSLCLANKVAVTTFRCNLFQLKRHRNASAAGALPRTPITALPQTTSWVFWRG